jgi:hypothetical protein
MAAVWFSNIHRLKQLLGDFIGPQSIFAQDSSAFPTEYADDDFFKQKIKHFLDIYFLVGKYIIFFDEGTHLVELEE